MKSLLLVTSIVGFVFFRACGSNSVKKDSSKDSLTNEQSKQHLVDPTDTTQSTKSEIQYSDPLVPNQQNGVKGDTTKRIYYHQVPNQHELDSIKKAKTKLKNN